MDSRSFQLEVQQWLYSNEAITSLDPLGFDDKIRTLHLLNQSKDVQEIIQFLYRLLPVPDQLDRFNYDEAIAAMRDLGIVIGILKKNGIEPVEKIPELEYVLLVLMIKTELPPRDTLLHYTIWNPSGKRMRTYTGLPDEAELINSVNIAFPKLMEAIAQLHTMHHRELSGPAFESACVELREKIEHMVKAIVHAKKKVSPAVFSNELRFYFDPIKVDYNKEYIGPGAVEMPMFVFDHLLWSCDIQDAVYLAFKEGYLPYNLPFIRRIYAEYKTRPSLLSRITQQLICNASPENLRAASSALDLCTVLKSFRMPHKKVAEDAYKHQDDYHKSKGSGGYTVGILEHIILLQNNCINALQQKVSDNSTQHEHVMANRFPGSL